MPSMKSQPIARLEAQLEHLIEGTFASLFGRRIQAQDVALHLARALMDNAGEPAGNDPRQIAPDDYVIHLNPLVQYHLLEKHPQLGQILSEHLIELASQSGYRMLSYPTLKILADPELERTEIRIAGRHIDPEINSTAALKRVEIPAIPVPNNPSLILDQQHTIYLKDDVVNIGRHRDNQIVIDDPYVSRYHAQLRLRFGSYLLFDIRSQGGTYVNGIQVKEHRLRSGDVIRIGRTQLLYLEDNPTEDSDVEKTDAFDPL